MIRCLAEATEKYGLNIHAFCLMENHYRLEVETSRGNFSQAMHWLKTAYAVYFNKRHRRSGHLFQGRFLAALVEKEAHLMALTRYIHLNPVRAGMVERTEDFFWSSYRDYIRAGQRWKWLDIGWTLDQFGGTDSKGRLRYRRCIEEGMTQGLMDPLRVSIKGVILGSDRFVEWVQERFLDHRVDSPAVSVSKQIRKIAVTEVIRRASEVMGVPEHIIRARGRHGNEARELAIYLSHKHSGETNVVIW